MRYKLLGNSGLRVSELALGTMTFGDENGHGVADEKVSRELFDAFLEAGGNFIDTANDYTGRKSEAHLGKFISSSTERDRFVIQQNTALTCARTTRIAEETVAKVWCIRSRRSQAVAKRIHQGVDAVRFFTSQGTNFIWTFALDEYFCRPLSPH